MAWNGIVTIWFLLAAGEYLSIHGNKLSEYGRGFAPGALLLAVLIIGSMIGAAIRLYQGG